MMIVPDPVPFRSPAAATHREEIAAFQADVGAFVWGRQRETDELWHLDENTGATNRPYVRKHIVCPVPGCSEPLTSAHRKQKRDGLKHFAGRGGHSAESVLHSQGCALIQDWLTRKYPRSRVRREEYTNEKGERRADVLITGPTGRRVAIEVQCSPLTPEAWQARHDSYREQEIVDVWLFGSTRHHFRLDARDRFRPNPTQRALLRSSPLLFLNPDTAAIGVVVGNRAPFVAERETKTSVRVPVLDTYEQAELRFYPLAQFEIHPVLGLISDDLTSLREATMSLRKQDEEQRELERILQERERREAIENEERQQREAAGRLARRIEERAPRIEEIRTLLDGPGPWERSDAVGAIWVYLGGRLGGRFDLHRGLQHESVPVRWQCAIYFDLIAGREEGFSVRDALEAIHRRSIDMGQSDASILIAGYLDTLVRSNALRQGQASFFIPTEHGAWW